MELVKELILVLERADPNVVVLTLVVAALIVWSMSRHARDIVVNVLRPVRAQDRALERRGVQYKTFPITQIEQLSPNVRRFRVGLASPDACLGRHGHLSLKAVVDGQRVVRPYTPVSPPWQKGSADFVIKKYEYGTLTPHLFKLKVGDTISMRGPYGGIKYTANQFSKYLFIGAGTGLTPLLQTITIALNNPGDTTQLVFIFQNRSEDDIIMRKELEKLAAQEERLTLGLFLSRAPSGWAARRPGIYFEGYVDAAKLRHLMGETPAGKAAVCGPPGFNNAMKELLPDLGVNDIRCM